jgi:hypothetical protein
MVLHRSNVRPRAAVFRPCFTAPVWNHVLAPGKRTVSQALPHRLGMEHRKPQAVPRKPGPEKQAAFMKSYENLVNHIGEYEAVLFADAVHPAHAVRPLGCRPQRTHRSLLNKPAAYTHGSIDLETGETRMIGAMYPGKRPIRLFRDDARYHRAKLVQAWAAAARVPDELHFFPACWPASRCERAALVLDAQSVSRDIRGLQSGDPDLIWARRRPEIGAPIVIGLNSYIFPIGR